MGKIISSLLNQLFPLVYIIFYSMSLNAQEGKVWTRINNFIATGISTVNGEVVATNPTINNLIADLNITSIAQALPAARTEGLKNVYEIACNCDENVLLQEVARLSTLFTNPELAPVYETLNTPNDYYTTFANDYALNLINAQNAWNITTGDSSIVIAVCDENFVVNHEELIGKYNYVTPNNMNPTTTHGTAVAVTAAGRTNNNLGKSSIGYNSTLQLRAMNYNEVLAAAYGGARVINLSWSSGCFANSFTQQIVDEVYNNGVVLIASAGNGNTCGGPSNLVYPAAHDHVISVTSVGPSNNHERIIGNPSTTHQHNATVDIAAPGYDVALTVASGLYLTSSGTSFAAPYVSGTVGLMLAVNPCLTVDQVEYILKETAFDLDSINSTYAGGLGAGRLDAYAAVRMASIFPTMQVGGSTSVNCETSSQSVTLNIQNGVAPYQIAWNTNDTTLTLDNLQDGFEYMATVTDATGCIGTYELVADTVTPVTFGTQIKNVNCNGENSGSIELEITDGIGPFQYIWNNTETTEDIYNLTAGAYNVRIVDAYGCSKYAYFDVSQPEILIVTGEIINVNNSLYTVDITVSGGTEPYTFNWNNGCIVEDLLNVQNGFYEVEVLDSLNCDKSYNVLLEYNDLISISNLTPEVIIRPNPSENILIVEWQNFTPDKLTIFSLDGELLLSSVILENDKKITINDFNRNNYILQLSNASNQNCVKIISLKG